MEGEMRDDGYAEAPKADGSMFRFRRSMVAAVSEVDGRERLELMFASGWRETVLATYEELFGYEQPPKVYTDGDGGLIDRGFEIMHRTETHVDGCMCVDCRDKAGA
jgi:hypothetical protein